MEALINYKIIAEEGDNVVTVENLWKLFQKVELDLKAIKDCQGDELLEVKLLYILIFVFIYFFKLFKN